MSKRCVAVITEKRIAEITVMGMAVMGMAVMWMVVIGGLGVGGHTYHEQPQTMESNETEWSPDMDCSGCHSEQVASPKDDVHAEVGVTCFDCHEEEALEQHHQAALAGNPVTKLKVDKETCFNCHMEHNPHTSYEELAELKDYTNPDLNPHDSHIGRLQCRACHHIHKVSQNKCAECHMERTWPWKEVP